MFVQYFEIVKDYMYAALLCKIMWLMTPYYTLENCIFFLSLSFPSIHMQSHHLELDTM